MTRSTLFLVCVVLLVVAFIAGVYYFYGKNLVNSNAPINKINSNAPKQQLNDLVPIDPDNPAVKSAGFVYTIKGNITDLSEVDIKGVKMTKLTTDLKGKRMPSVFYVDPKTKVNVRDAGKSSVAKSSDLQKGQTIELTVRKGLKQNVFQTTTVVILRNQPKAATPSASAN